MKKSAAVCLTVVMMCLFAVRLFAVSGLAQPSVANTTAGAAEAAIAEQSARIAKLEQAVTDARSAGDNAWMLTSSALVLMMTGPGLALFYGGLVRKKNVLSTMMQSFALMAIVTLLWGVVLYSLAFASGNSFIGGLHSVFLRGVGGQPDADYSATIPLQTFMVYQLMFAIITPALIIGRVRGAHEIQRDGGLHGAVVARGVCPHGAHGLGEGRTAERLSRWTVPLSGFCRRHGGAHYVGGIGAGVCVVSGTRASGIRKSPCLLIAWF